MTAEEMKQQWPLDEWTAPKKTLLLYNMFSPRDVEKKAETKFLDGIKDHFREQCTKYGKVVQITVDPRAIEGRLYVLFDCPSERQAAKLPCKTVGSGTSRSSQKPSTTPCGKIFLCRVLGTCPTFLWVGPQLSERC